MAERMWGRMSGFNLSSRVVSLTFIAAAIVSMSFCQLGFWPIGVVDNKPVYIMLILAPLVAGALMTGPITGALLGLFAGAVVYAHATFIPLDYYEVYFMTPLNTFGLLFIVGGVSGLLFDLVLRRTSKGVPRVVLIGVVGIVLSFMASGLMMLGTVIAYGGMEYIDLIQAYLFNSPPGVVLQAFVDAALIVFVCGMVGMFMERAASSANDRTLLSVFRNWMLLVSAIVFMLTSAVIFSSITLQAQVSDKDAMLGEVRFLTSHLNLVKVDSYDMMLEGYDAETDGYVVITDKMGSILTSDYDELFTPGDSFLKSFGYEPEDFGVGDDVTAALESLVTEDDVAVLQLEADGVMSLDFTYAVCGAFDGGFVFILHSPDLVYANRLSTMTATTLLAVLLITAIAIVAAVLLNSVVVRRIDETNDSLEKITGGNLNERVHVSNTAEFTSLSAGINTTVSALKDTIAEVEQRNAQDLATAKAIQESALPRDFPPFPEIDRFDIYASMKTAKEVGGDFYDFFLIEGDGHDVSKLGFVTADVSGKGIPAALFMMAAKTQIRNYMEAGIPLNEAVDAANHQLCISNDAGMFVTIWVGVLDYVTGSLTYVNGGHNPPLLLHDGSWEWLKKTSGMPLGLFDGIPYDAFTLQLEAGDMLYVYTDGVTEAMNQDDELFGEERLEATLEKYSSINPRSVGVGVRRAITDFTLDCEQSDDITMLILKYGVPPEKKAVMVLPAVDTQLVHVYNFIHEELHRRGAPRSVRNPLDIAAEELFVNVCHYAYPDATPENPGEVRIGFEYESSPPSLTVTISDDGIPYNPLAKPDAVTPDDIADVPIGGLGILMAKRSVDEMYYERVGESNVLTFKKVW